MKLKQIRDDTRGGVIIEFTVTMGLFVLFTFGVVQAGLLLWTIVGLQHGVDMAARCASVNYSALRLGSPVKDVNSCFGVAPTAVTTDTIRNYAAANSLGIHPDFTGFLVTPTTHTTGGACPPDVGYLVQATARPINLLSWIFTVPTFTITSKFSITCS